MSQNAILRNYLESGNRITPLEALNWWGMFRLGARIHELKGIMEIDSHFVTVINRNGDECRVKEYWAVKP